MSLCIGTGWCAQNTGHNNPARSKQQNSELWLASTWAPAIKTQIEPGRWFFYLSQCDISPVEIYTLEKAEFVFANKPAIEMSYRHDWSSSITMGALYAFENDMDFLYIEQDCMVKNIPGVLEFAQDKPMCYGYGQYSYARGWAEASLVWIRNDFLPVFVARMVETNFNAIPDAEKKAEVYFHEMFGNTFTAWPFGYGRKRPIDWTQPTFYAQQLTDQEIREFQYAVFDLPGVRR